VYPAICGLPQCYQLHQGLHIIEQSRNALVSGGFLLLEHGWQQGEAVRQAFILAGYHDVETCRDYGDNERVTLGRYYQ
jgi:release factor glutamine methyltransferase